MESPPAPPSEPKRPIPRPRINNSTFALVVTTSVAIFLFVWAKELTGRATISYGYFLEQPEAGNIATAKINGLDVTGQFVVPPSIPPGKWQPKIIPQVGYGEFLKRFEADDVAEAHTDGREIIGRFKTPTKPTGSTASPPAGEAGEKTATAATQKDKPPPPPPTRANFRVRLGLTRPRSGREAARQTRHNYTVEATLDGYYTFFEPATGDEAKQPPVVFRDFRGQPQPASRRERRSFASRKVNEENIKAIA